MSTTPPASPQTAPDPETITDTSASAMAPRAATGMSPSGLATAIAERDQYEDARKAQFLEFRRWLVPSLFALTVVWLIFVGCIVLREELHGRLSDAVLIALLGTATANVLGLLIIVLKSIFPLDIDRGEG